MKTTYARQEPVDPTAVRRVVGGDATKSDKIRELHRLGMRTADIARALDIRYQFARNVLARDERRTAPATQFSASERDRVTALTRGLSTKAARIRALAAAGLDRSYVANALGLSYQHVYNVLSAGAPLADRVADAGTNMANAGPDAYPTAVAVPDPPDDEAPGPDPVRAVVESEGRVAIRRPSSTRFDSRRVIPSCSVWRATSCASTARAPRSGACSVWLRSMSRPMSVLSTNSSRSDVVRRSVKLIDG